MSILRCPVGPGAGKKGREARREERRGRAGQAMVTSARRGGLHLQ